MSAPAAPTSRQVDSTIARHITEDALPGYAPAFLLSRYQDAAYSALLDRWGDGGQL